MSQNPRSSKRPLPNAVLPSITGLSCCCSVVQLVSIIADSSLTCLFLVCTQVTAATCCLLSVLFCIYSEISCLCFQIVMNTLLAVYIAVFQVLCCHLLCTHTGFCVFLLCVALLTVCRLCDLTVSVCCGWACECVRCGVVSSLCIRVIALQPTLSIMQSTLREAVEGRARALLYLLWPKC